VNPAELKSFVQANPQLVRARDAGNGLFVLKYTKRVFFDNLWNEFLEECRGTIVDADYNLVSRPFTKIYNYGIESRAPVLAPDTPVTAYRKVNGFMVAVTWHNKDILVSTTGSTDSPYVAMAREMMLKHMPWTDWQIAVRGAKDFTLMFECVHPDDPHIVPEQPGMYFLGYRENTWDSQIKMYGQDMADWARDYAIGQLKCYYAEPEFMTVTQLVEKTRSVRHEGFVAYTESNQAFKIKSPYYLTAKWVARNPRTDKLMRDDFRNQIDEEYYPLLAAIRADIEAYTALSEQERLEWVRKFLT
jgi:hypothetical protein